MLGVLHAGLNPGQVWALFFAQSGVSEGFERVS